MVKLVLRDPMQHVIEVVTLPGNTVAEARFGQGSDGSDEPIVRAFRFRDGLAPRIFRRSRHQRKIRITGGLAYFSTQAT